MYVPTCVYCVSVLTHRLPIVDTEQRRPNNTGCVNTLYTYVIWIYPGFKMFNVQSTRLRSEEYANAK